VTDVKDYIDYKAHFFQGYMWLVYSVHGKVVRCSSCWPYIYS